MKYPVAEHFLSIQGEGTWTGTPMLFLRLAGCNVGKYTGVETQPSLPFDPTHLKVLQNTYPTHSTCKAWDGTRFLCDTDYHKTQDLDVNEILHLTKGLTHVCITGGEPFLHDLAPLVRGFQQIDILPHIETSGTLPIPETVIHTSCWITCSPKADFLPTNYDLIDEWKLLISQSTTEASIKAFFAEFLGDFEDRPIYLQPLGDLESHFQASLDQCWEILQSNPEWRLSAQTHKYLRMR